VEAWGGHLAHQPSRTIATSATAARERFLLNLNSSGWAAAAEAEALDDRDNYLSERTTEKRRAV
jgi:hypothetical protein